MFIFQQARLGINTCSPNTSCGLRPSIPERVAEKIPLASLQESFTLPLKTRSKAQKDTSRGIVWMTPARFPWMLSTEGSHLDSGSFPVSSICSVRCSWIPAHLWLHFSSNSPDCNCQFAFLPALLGPKITEVFWFSQWIKTEDGWKDECNKENCKKNIDPEKLLRSLLTQISQFSCFTWESAYLGLPRNFMPLSLMPKIQHA
jgi:hypothetical protein